MEKNVLTLVIIILQTIICCGQNSNLNTISLESNATKSCQKQIENKAIGLSDITSDTLTYQQFKHSNKIIFKSPLGVEITSYKLSYFLPNGTDLMERTVLNDKLSDEIIQRVISSGTKKIVFSEVTGAKGTEKVLFGYRSFYLK
ncbi:MAG: hypothetical protein ACOYN4_08305 [Bacteroidales bacterium]